MYFNWEWVKSAAHLLGLRHGRAYRAKFCAECGARLEPARRDARDSESSSASSSATSWARRRSASDSIPRRSGASSFATTQPARRPCTATGGRSRSSSATPSCASSASPSRDEDDAHRACRAALDLIAGIEALNVELEEVWGVRLVVRIGVNTGVGIRRRPERRTCARHRRSGEHRGAARAGGRPGRDPHRRNHPRAHRRRGRVRRGAPTRAQGEGRACAAPGGSST